MFAVVSFMTHNPLIVFHQRNTTAHNKTGRRSNILVVLAVETVKSKFSHLCVFMNVERVNVLNNWALISNNQSHRGPVIIRAHIVSVFRTISHKESKSSSTN